MYSARSTSLISGLVAGAAIAIVSVVQLSRSSTPDPLAVKLIAGGAVAAALVTGSLVALMVRLGLLLAGSRQLTVQFALTIAAVTVAMMVVLGTAPIETHAVKLDMTSSRTAHVDTPLIFWLVIAAALSVPVIVSYVVGKIAGGRADAS